MHGLFILAFWMHPSKREHGADRAKKELLFWEMTFTLVVGNFMEGGYTLLEAETFIVQITQCCINLQQKTLPHLPSKTANIMQDGLE